METIIPKNWNLDLPKRTLKPRQHGLTEISDKGLGLNQLKDILDISGDYIDYAKFSIGSAVVTGLLKEKIEIYLKNDIKVFFGGTTFEKFYRQNKLDDFEKVHHHFGVGMIEISDGTINIDINEKCRIIERFAKNFQVVAEVGCKDESIVYSKQEWVTQIGSCLKAGAWKVIVEGRESGSAGIYNSDGTPRSEMSAIVDAFSTDDLIFEAPKAYNQIELINRFGPNVNLGNISPFEVLILESQRVGLRYDTF